PSRPAPAPTSSKRKGRPVGRCEATASHRRRCQKKLRECSIWRRRCASRLLTNLMLQVGEGNAARLRENSEEHDEVDEGGKRHEENEKTGGGCAARDSRTAK